MSNPFFFGKPVTAKQFLGRKKELRRLNNRIRHEGQSTAIVGSSKSGKTSLLKYLASADNASSLSNRDCTHIIFTYIDIQAIGQRFNQAQFWQHALRELYEQAIKPNLSSPLAKAYQTCEENMFGSFVLERLIAHMKLAGWRLVLLIDEFDTLLHHPILNSTEFFGTLRSRISLSEGALSLIFASHLSVS